MNKDKAKANQKTNQKTERSQKNALPKQKPETAGKNERKKGGCKNGK